jgi:hypothetical protein
MVNVFLVVTGLVPLVLVVIFLVWPALLSLSSMESRIYQVLARVFHIMDPYHCSLASGETQDRFGLASMAGRH